MRSAAPDFYFSMLKKPQIFNPSEKPVQVFLTDKVVQGYILEKILEYAAPASIVVSTFSTGEEFLRKVISLRKSGAILRASLFCDHKAAEKTARVNSMLFSAFDEVRFEVIRMCFQRWARPAVRSAAPVFRFHHVKKTANI